MIAQNRKTVLAAWAAILQSALVGVGKPVQAVYDYPVGDFQNQSPVVTVSSGGSERRSFTFQGTIPNYDLLVDVFVIYAADGGWTEDMTEDALDDIELAIAEAVAANQVTAYWQSLSIVERTQPTYVVIGGAEYRRELIRVRAE